MFFPDSAVSGSPRFPSTAWSCIRAAQKPDNPEHKNAVSRLVSLYWKPVFYFIRARKIPFADAQDLTQEFFLHLLEQDAVEKADPHRGRFRNFLCKVLQYFLSDQGPQRAPRQKAFERSMISLNGLLGEEERSYEPAAGETPDEVFNRKWAAAVWNTVGEELRLLFAAENRPDWYDIALAYLAPEGKRPSQESLAEQFKLSRDRVREILEKAKKRFDRLLRAELREQGVREPELECEIENLKQLLGR